jgi:hypothetical protein
MLLCGCELYPRTVAGVFATAKIIHFQKKIRLFVCWCVIAGVCFVSDENGDLYYITLADMSTAWDAPEATAAALVDVTALSTLLATTSADSVPPVPEEHMDILSKYLEVMIVLPPLFYHTPSALPLGLHPCTVPCTIPLACLVMNVEFLCV